MKRLIATAFLVGTLGFLANPKPADALGSGPTGCLQKAVESCDKDFQGNNAELIAIRGWCYMIRAAICKVF